MHPVSYMISRLRILHGSIDIFHVFRAACLQPCVPRPSLFPGGLSEISSLAFFRLLCYNPNRLTECSMRGSALVLRSIQLLDDEDQIARESVFRAERIPERIDRPMPRIHVRGLSAFCQAADPCPRLVSILPESHFYGMLQKACLFLYPPVSSGFMAAECVLFLIRNDHALTGSCPLADIETISPYFPVSHSFSRKYILP